MLSLSHLTSCTPTKSNFYLANTLGAAVSEPALYRQRYIYKQANKQTQILYSPRCLYDSLM